MGECHLPIYNKDKCVLFALGRNAMYAACQSLGLKRGDEVLTPAYDCDGSLQPFRALGLMLSFLRSDPYTFSADLSDIKRKITKNTKLLHIINHFGMPQPWPGILAIAREHNIPVLEDNAYSIFSKIGDKLFGTFGDFSIFSLRKNLPLIDGGLLRVNNPPYPKYICDAKISWCQPADRKELVRFITRSFGMNSIAKLTAKALHLYLDAPPPLYSEREKGHPEWQARDEIGREFSCDYFRPMSRISRMLLNSFSAADYEDIAAKKRHHYTFLSKNMGNIKGIKVLWPELHPGTVPFCLSVIVSRNRDKFLNVLRNNYDVMAWPTLSGAVLERIDEFPDVELLGRNLLQMNLPSDRVRQKGFSLYLSRLCDGMHILAERFL